MPPLKQKWKRCWTTFKSSQLRARITYVCLSWENSNQSQAFTGSLFITRQRNLILGNFFNILFPSTSSLWLLTHVLVALYFLYSSTDEKAKTAPLKLSVISSFPSTSSFPQNFVSMFFYKAFKHPLPWKHAAAPPCTALEKWNTSTLPRKQGVRRWPEGIQERNGDLQCLMCSTDANHTANSFKENHSITYTRYPDSFRLLPDDPQITTYPEHEWQE